MKNTFLTFITGSALVFSLLFGNILTANAVSSVTRLATATISPTSTSVNENTVFTVTIARDNTSTSDAGIGSIDILLPVGFGTPTLGAINSGSNTWIMEEYDSDTRKIRLQADKKDDELDGAEQISFSVTTTAPASVGEFEWTTLISAAQNYSASAGNIFVVASQPTVTVNGTVATTATISANSTTIEAPGSAELTVTLEDSNGDPVSNGTSFVLLSSIGAMSGDDTTVGGSAVRSLFSSILGMATLSIDGLTVTGDTEITFVDTTAPTITLLGSNPVDVWVGDSYEDAGATATDAFDGNLTAEIAVVNEVDTNTLGTYLVTYNVTDSNDNGATEVTRTVNVVDVGKPIITLNGTSEVNVEINSTYSDAGATAEDNLDGDLTSSIVVTGLPIDTSVLGDKTITYNVSDLSGNHATEITRTVHVVDTLPPVLTVSGDNPVRLLVGASFTDAGATVTDNSGADLSQSIVTSGTVDAQTAGTYTLTYSATDASNNTGSTTRSIIVRVPGSDASLSALGVSTGVLNPVFDANTTSYTVTLAHDATEVPDVTPTLTDSFASFEVADANNLMSQNDEPRTTTIEVTAEDGTTTKTYSVLFTRASAPDTTAPVITLNGVNPTYVNLDAQYADAGATAVDELDGSVEVDSENNVDTGTLGEYTVTYTASDTAGNVATSSRVVIVRAPSSDASLSSLTVATGILSPSFASSTLEYTVALAFDAENTPVVTATATDEGATVEIFDAMQITSENEKLRTTRVVVTAQDGVTVVTYSIEFNPAEEADIILPVITILGDNPVSITEGDSYTDAGATASDNIDGDITQSMQTQNNVDSNTPGTYFVIYTATDSSENTRIESRTVNVVARSSGGSSGGSSRRRVISDESGTTTSTTILGTNNPVVVNEDGEDALAFNPRVSPVSVFGETDGTDGDEGSVGGIANASSTASTTASSSQLAAIGSSDASNNLITYLLELVAAGLVGYGAYYFFIRRRN